MQQTQQPFDQERNTSAIMSLSKKAMAKRLSMMEQAILMLQQIANQSVQTSQGLDNRTKFLQDLVESLQLKIEIIAQEAGLNLDTINQKVDLRKIAMFDENSARDDAEQGLIKGIEVKETSLVTITSTHEGKVGFLRSKLDLKDIRLKFLKDALLGKKIGDKVETDINKEKHIVEILDIKEDKETPKE